MLLLLNKQKQIIKSKSRTDEEITERQKHIKGNSTKVRQQKYYFCFRPRKQRKKYRTQTVRKTFFICPVNVNFMLLLVF